MARMPGVGYSIPPASYTSGRGPFGQWAGVCWHYTAGAESTHSARDGAAYDDRRTDGTSCHFFVDGNPDPHLGIIQEVDTNDRAHSALYNGNGRFFHIELCGTLQTRAAWLDPISRQTITNAAKVTAWLCKMYDIPLVRLVDRQVRTGRGICGHVDITNGFPEDNGSHTDPGPAFPWDVAFADTLYYMTHDGGDMPLTDADVDKIVNGLMNANVPRPTNLNYPDKPDGTSGNPAGWPTSGATGQPRFDYIAHLAVARGTQAGVIADQARLSAEAAKAAALDARTAAVAAKAGTVGLSDRIANLETGGASLTPEQMSTIIAGVSQNVVTALAGLNLHGTWETFR